MPADSVLTCRRCGKSLVNPKGNSSIGFLCPECVAADSYKAVLALQQGFLPGIISRDWPPLEVKRRAGRKEWHIEMLGPYKGQGFCGVLFNGDDWSGRKDGLKYSEVDETPHLCPECRRILAVEAIAVRS